MTDGYIYHECYLGDKNKLILLSCAVYYPEADDIHAIAEENKSVSSNFLNIYIILPMTIGFYLLVFTVLISNSIQLSAPIREYVIKKDMYSGFKAGQFSIYSDKAQRNLSYRIESYYSPMQKIDLQTYPQKKVIGKLNAHELGPTYEARYEILDTRNGSNKWFTGLIKRKSTWFTDNYSISLAERTISMKRKFFSSTIKFFNEAAKLLASSKTLVFKIRGSSKYDLKIYSNEFLDGIYILAMAAHDHKNAKTVAANDTIDSQE